jgi:hypothetical protein
MVTHYSKSQAINRKDRGKKLKPVSDPLPPMLKGLSANGVFAAKKGPPHTSTGDMSYLNGMGIKIFATS